MSVGWQSPLPSPILNCLPKSSSTDLCLLDWLPTQSPRVLDDNLCFCALLTLRVWTALDWWWPVLTKAPSVFMPDSILDVLSELLASGNSLKLPRTDNSKERMAPTNPESVSAEYVTFERQISQGKSLVNSGGRVRRTDELEGYDCTWQPLYCV